MIKMKRYTALFSEKVEIEEYDIEHLPVISPKLHHINIKDLSDEQIDTFFHHIGENFLTDQKKLKDLNLEDAHLVAKINIGENRANGSNTQFAFILDDGTIALQDFKNLGDKVKISNHPIKPYEFLREIKDIVDKIKSGEITSEQQPEDAEVSEDEEIPESDTEDLTSVEDLLEEPGSEEVEPEEAETEETKISRDQFSPEGQPF